MFRFFFFFFSSRRRHTRSYGDWSSDVCSSDLFDSVPAWHHAFARTESNRALHQIDQGSHEIREENRERSEERRVGKECRSRGCAEPEKKKARQKTRTGTQRQHKTRSTRTAKAA